MRCWLCGRKWDSSSDFKRCAACKKRTCPCCISGDTGLCSTCEGDRQICARQFVTGLPEENRCQI